MKFTANTLALQKALIPFIDLNPLREKIMVGLNLKSGMLTVSFCDEGEVFKMKSELQVSDAEDGTVFLSYKEFWACISIIKEETVFVELKDENIFSISYGNKIIELNTNNDDCAVEKIELDNIVPSVELTGKDFKRIIRQTIRSVSEDENRPAMAGVYFNKVGNILEAAATNGRIIAVSKLPCDKDFEAFRISSKSLYISQKYMQNEDTVKVYYDGEKSVISFGNIFIEQKEKDLSEMPFPKYRKVFTEFKNKTVISKSNFYDSLRSFANSLDDPMIIRISIEKNQFEMKSESSKVTISCSEVSESFTAELNLVYMMNIVSLIEAEELEVYFGAENGSSMLQIKIKESDSYEALIAPLIDK